MHFRPDEGRGEAQHHRAALRNPLATVERISHDTEVRGHDGGCTGAGYPQGSHGLTAQELSDAGAKHLPAVTVSEGNCIVVTRLLNSPLWLTSE